VHEAATGRVLNREIFMLVVLAFFAIGVFVFTKSMATKEQQMDARIAAVWYNDGQRQFNSGQVDKAINSFRKARTRSLGDRVYALALANALVAGGHDAEAQQSLLRLREADPEDAEINSQLARLAAKRGQVQDAVHYYQNALYGRWAGPQVDERKLHLRMELIRVLLRQQQRNSALSELLILETELLQSAADHVETARLFLQAGDAQHALANYAEAIDLDKNNVEAYTEAGETLFRLGDYLRAERYLEAALVLNPKAEMTRHLLLLAKMVVAADPLEPHISKQESWERLLRALKRASHRLNDCLMQTTNSQKRTQLGTLKQQDIALESELHSSRPPNSELTKSGVDLIYAIEKETSGIGETPDGFDQALLLIGQKHGGVQL
jgi:tetratricopeptide (TPR) repeat protein